MPNAAADLDSFADAARRFLEATAERRSDEAAAVEWGAGPDRIAYFSSDPQAEVERLTKAGAPLIVSMELDGKPIYFHDGRDTHGFIIEHCAYSEVIESIYGAVADAAANWDGTDPVRGPLF